MTASTKKSVPVRLNRKSPESRLDRFTDYFQGFERVAAVSSVFGDETEKVLSNLRIGFVPNRRMYMGIRDNDGNLAVGTYHLRTSPTRILYLDIVHELVHINQRMTREKWFHDEFMKFMVDRSLYYASPIEIQAYEHTVREAERIGMTKKEILEYLKIGDSPPKVWANFLKEMKLHDKLVTSKRVTRFPVKIKRETSPKLHPFKDYFKGFEKVTAVRELFGDSTEATLGTLKVEFIDSPFPMIYPSEEDGHLIVANQYFREGPLNAIYLDVILGLNIMKAASEVEAGDGSPDAVWNSPGMLRAHSEMVKEAKKIGTSDAEIMTHLRFPSFMMTPAAYKKFLRSIGVKRT